MSLVQGAAAQIMFLGGFRLLDQVQDILGLAGREIGGRKLISNIFVSRTDQICRAKVNCRVHGLSMLEEELPEGCIPLKI